jgi:hypothetical protein
VGNQHVPGFDEAPLIRWEGALVRARRILAPSPTNCLVAALFRGSGLNAIYIPFSK